jgi:hypothetical protein
LKEVRLVAGRSSADKAGSFAPAHCVVNHSFTGGGDRMKVKISLVVVLATLIGATMTFGAGFNLVGWPLLPHDNSIQAVFADSMGSGCQLTGAMVPTLSDKVNYSPDGTSWLTAWYRTVGGWQGTLTTIDADRSYWIEIATGNPAVTLTMTGSVCGETRYIPILPGLSFNYVSSAFPYIVDLDDSGLIASGFTGAMVPTLSDKINKWDGSTWTTAWYRTVGGWQGYTTLEPGQGYILEVATGNSFTDDQWVYPVPPPSGSKAGLSKESKSRASQQVPGRIQRALSSSTNKSLVPERAVEELKTR